MVFIAALGAAAILANRAAPAEPQSFCFSDVCLGAGAGELARIALTDLKRVTAAGRTRPAAEDLAGSFPRLTAEERKILGDHRDSDGRLLLDGTTLPIALRIDQICTSAPPFVALFTSESGHLTSVRLDVVPDERGLRFAVTELKRSFKVKLGSAEDRALIGDLSRRYGFRIDAAASSKRAAGIEAGFERFDEGFRLSFTAATRVSPDAAPPLGCAPPNRIKID